MTLRAEIMADTPIRYHEFNAGTGADSSGNGNTATLGASITTGHRGPRGQSDYAVRFPGNSTTTNRITLTGSFPANGAAWSVESIIKIEGPGSTGATEYVTWFGASGTANWAVATQPEANGYPFVSGWPIFNRSGGNVFYEDAGGWQGDIWPIGEWVHVIATYAAPGHAIYINGYNTPLFNASATANTPQPYVGTYAGSAYELRGLLALHCWYNTTLSAARAQAHWAAYKAEIVRPRRRLQR